MASRTRSLKLPGTLADAAEIRAINAGYKSYNAYVKGLIRYDLLCQGPHSITLPWADLKPEEQDKIDTRLLEYTEKGQGERGQLLERIIERVKATGKKSEEVLCD